MSSPPPPPSTGTPKPATPYVRARRPIGKSLLHLTRTLHTYVTMFALILLTFFSFTGFILNNGKLYDNSGKLFDLTSLSYAHRTAEMPVALLSGKEHLYAIEQYLRRHEGAQGTLPEKINEDDPLMLSFPFDSPGRKVEYAIAKDSGHIEINEEYNTLARLTDLHRGERTGRAWPWVIDATAVFLFFAALSGLILWISLPKRRALGIIALVTSLAACFAAYYWMVL